MKLKSSPRFMASLLMLLMLLLVAGCSDLDKGVVTSKEHHGVWTQRTQTNMIFIGQVMMPQIIHHPELWTLNIAASGQHGYCNVTKERFDATNIGDWIECN